MRSASLLKAIAAVDFISASAMLVIVLLSESIDLLIKVVVLFAEAIPESFNLAFVPKSILSKASTMAAPLPAPSE